MKKTLQQHARPAASSQRPLDAVDVRRFHALTTELRAMLDQAMSHEAADERPSIRITLDGEPVADYGADNMPSPKDAVDAAEELQFIAETLLARATTARAEEALEQAA